MISTISTSRLSSWLLNLSAFSVASFVRSFVCIFSAPVIPPLATKPLVSIVSVLFIAQRDIICYRPRIELVFSSSFRV